jgi:hypothetical protein
MRVGTCLIKLALDEARSLKDKRRVIKSLKDRVQADFNVSISEVGAGDFWQSAEIGVAVVSNDGRFCQQVIDKVVDRVRAFHGCRLVDYETELQ